MSTVTKKELIERIAQPGDMVMAASVGVAGLAPVLAAIERGCHIALANKETLVAAGSVVREAVARKGVELLPVDSEHSAVFQCLRSGTLREVDRLVLTASGGPFRTWSAERTANATVAEALRHPTWQMGRKVTLDSASLRMGGGVIWNALLLLMLLMLLLLLQHSNSNWLGKHEPPEALIESYDSFKSRE